MTKTPFIIKELDIKKTHTLIEVPKWGKVWVILDIADYYKRLEEALATQRKEIEEGIEKIEKDALAIGLTKQGRQIIERFKKLL